MWMCWSNSKVINVRSKDHEFEFIVVPSLKICDVGSIVETPIMEKTEVEKDGNTESIMQIVGQIINLGRHMKVMEIEI